MPAAGRHLAVVRGVMLHRPVQLGIQAHLCALAVRAGALPAVLAARTAPARGNARGRAGRAVRDLWDLPPGISGGPCKLPCP